MNAPLLPTGTKQPLRGDVALSISPPAPPEPEQHIHTKSEPSPIRSAARRPLSRLDVTPHHRHLATNLPNGAPSDAPSDAPSGAPSGARASTAASLAFIPRSSRNSAGIRKPLHLCTEFELEHILDRNQRILATLAVSHTPTSQRLKWETDAIRDAIRSIRAMRDVNTAITAVQLVDPSSPSQLESALLCLSVAESPSPADSSRSTQPFGWSRDTIAVKKKLAHDSTAYHPGRKVQAMCYEQSLAIQTAALLAERQRESETQMATRTETETERRTEDSRSRITTREKPSLSVPSGAAHKLGRKSISSCSGSLRKHSISHSASPPKPWRAAGALARVDHGMDNYATLADADADSDQGHQDQDSGEPDDEDHYPYEHDRRYQDHRFAGVLDQHRQPQTPHFLSRPHRQKPSDGSHP